MRALGADCPSRTLPSPAINGKKPSRSVERLRPRAPDDCLRLKRRISGWGIGSGYESDADRIAHQTGYVVHAQSLHDFTAMTLDRLDAQPESLRDCASAVSLCNQPQYLDLSLGEFLQRPPHDQSVV